jgi:alpha/beta superfamily hydrolase
MKEQKISIPSKGIQLEGLLGVQEAFPVKGGLVFCHPHPQHGGDMHNGVVAKAVGAAFQEGFTTLRFNFRGVGESEGSYGEGIEEKEDVRAAVEYLLSTLKGLDPFGGAKPRLLSRGEEMPLRVNPEQAEAFRPGSRRVDSILIVGGYSFGAMMSLPIAVQDDRIKGVVAVAPPLEMHDFGFMKGYRRKKLIIAGDQDLFCPKPLLEKWYERLDEPKSLAIIKGADHFLFSHTRELIQPLQQFFKAFA